MDNSNENQSNADKTPEEMIKEMQDKGIPAIGCVPIKTPITTKIYIRNTRKAEDLADKLLAWSGQTISESLSKNPDVDPHLPVDTTSGMFITLGDGDYIQFYRCNPCIVKVDKKASTLTMEPFIQVEDKEDGTKEKIYVDCIYINPESVIQCYNNGEIEIAVIKDLMDEDVFVVSLG